MCFYVFKTWENYKLFATFSSNPEIPSLEIEFNILWIIEYWSWFKAEEAVELTERKRFAQGQIALCS